VLLVLLGLLVLGPCHGPNTAGIRLVYGWYIVYCPLLPLCKELQKTVHYTSLEHLNSTALHTATLVCSL